MTRFLVLSLLFFTVTAHAQYVYEDVINAERFGHLQLATPFAIAKGPDGRLFVACNNQIAILNSNGNQLGAINIKDVPYNYAYSLFVDKNNNLYVGAYGKVLVYNATGDLIRTFGSIGTGSGEFYLPLSIVADSAGNILILDTYNSRVIVFDANGNFLYDFLNTGWGYSMTIDNDDIVYITADTEGVVKKFKNGVYLGPFIQAFYPDNITIDSEGNFYLMSFAWIDNLYWGPVVTKYNHQGDSLSSVKGIDQISVNGNPIYQFYQLRLVPNGSGGVYGAESSTNRILNINFDSDEISEIVKVNHAGQTNLPGDTDIDSIGNVYVVDGINDAIQVFDYTGNYLRKIQINSPGFGSLVYSYQIDIDQDGLVFVLNSRNKVSVFNSDGESFDDWGFTERRYGIDIVVDDSLVYILGSNNNDSDSLINVYTKAGIFQRTIFDNSPDENFDSPQCMARDFEGNFVVGKSNGRVDFFSNEGVYLRSLEGNYSDPVKSIKTDSNNLFIARHSYVQIFNSSDSLIQVIDNIGSELGQFNQIEGLSTHAGRLYVSDLYNNRVQVFSNLPGPTLTLNDTTINYIDGYFHIQAFTDSQDSIAYKTMAGTAGSFVSSQDIFLEHAGNVTIEASIAGTLSQRKATDNATIIVEKATLKFVVSDTTRIYGDENPEFSTYHVGLLRSDDNISEIDEMPEAVTNATKSSSVGEYEIILEGGLDDNYSFTYEPGILTIQKAPLYLTIEDTVKVYGDENPAFSFSYEGLKNNETQFVIDQHPGISTETTSLSPVGQYPLIVTGGQDDNYELFTAEGSLSIIKAPLHVIVEDTTRTYNTINPEFTVTYFGFKNGEDETVLDTTLVAGTIADQSTPVGQYSISLSMCVDNNYEFFYQDGILTITKANQQITFNELSSPVINTLPPFALNAISNSGLPVSYSVSTGPASLSSDSILTLSVELGTVTIAASQSGNENYNPANPVSRSFEVILDPILGTEDEINISVYPNPAIESFLIQGMSEQILEVALVDSKGLKIIMRPQVSDEDFRIDVSNISEGLYMLNVKSNSGQRYHQKVFIKK